MKRVLFTVTNNLNHDQRMQRICTSLAGAGYQVTLIGASTRGSTALQEKPYRQHRITTLFQKGFWFYAEYNTRLFFYLLFKGTDAICAIDLDTILPVWLATALRGKKRIYDAHEYFSQQKEVVTRPRVYRIWHRIEKKMIPRFTYGYTVSGSIAAEFKKSYGVTYELIRNMPLLKPALPSPPQKNKTILYQGAVNEARGLEFLVPAMQQVDATLLMYGDGNFMARTKALVAANNLDAKVLLKGKVLPEALDGIAATVWIGVNLVENSGLNQYFSLANKFFDYIHSGLPQLTMNYPEYRQVNDVYEVAVLINDLQPATIAEALNRLLNDDTLHERLRQNCLKAREVLNWQEEEKKLLGFYDKIFYRGDAETRKNTAT